MSAEKSRPGGQPWRTSGEHARMLATVLEFISIVLAGLLAGVEFVVRYGVQPALARLDDLGQLRARQALIRRLRVLVPAIMIPTVLTTVASVVVHDFVVLRWAGLGALVLFLVIAFTGTVPINIRIDQWQAEAPPADWRAVVRRWETIDIFRSAAAIVAFALLLAAVMFAP